MARLGGCHTKLSDPPFSLLRAVSAEEQKTMFATAILRSEHIDTLVSWIEVLSRLQKCLHCSAAGPTIEHFSLLGTKLRFALGFCWL